MKNSTNKRNTSYFQSVQVVFFFTFIINYGNIIIANMLFLIITVRISLFIWHQGGNVKDDLNSNLYISFWYIKWERIFVHREKKFQIRKIRTCMTSSFQTYANFPSFPDCSRPPKNTFCGLTSAKLTKVPSFYNEENY